MFDLTCSRPRWPCSWGWPSCLGWRSRCPSDPWYIPAPAWPQCQCHPTLGSRPRCRIFCPPASVQAPEVPGGDLCRKSDPAWNFRRSPTWKKILRKGKTKSPCVKHTLRAVHLSKWGFRIVWELLFVRPWKEKEVCEPSIKVCFAFLTQNIQKFNFWRTNINASNAVQRPTIVLLYWLLLCPTSRGTL